MTSELDDPNFDITSNLPTLQFQSAIQTSDEHFLPLRNRSHCLMAHACAQAAYFLKCLQLFRHALKYITNPGKNKASMRKMLDLTNSPKEQFTIGIIGGGKLGANLARVFLEEVKINQENILISTRDPERLESLSERGIHISFDNAKVAEQASVLFLCVLPCHILEVCEEIREHIASSAKFIIVFSSMQSPNRLRQLLEHENILTLRYRWNDANFENWPPTRSLETCFRTPELIQQTCPLLPSETNATFVSCEMKLMTTWVYAVTNLCAYHQLSLSQTVDMLNYVFLRQVPGPRAESSMGGSVLDDAESINSCVEQYAIVVEDLIKGKLKEALPIFDLCEIATRQTFFDNKLDNNAKFREKLLHSYLHTFAEMTKKHIV